MELVPYLSAVIFIATIATIVMATLSYAAFKLRNKRKPSAQAHKPVFFRRMDPHAGSAEPRRSEP